MTIFYQNFNAPKTPLASPLGVGTIIRFISTSINQEVKQELDNTAFYLYHDDRIILVATLRFKQATVTFNTKTEANTWGQEESIPIAGVFKGIGATIGILTNEQSYTISVDDKVIYTYQKRVQADANGVSYIGGANPTSHLSDPVAVLISNA